MFNYLVIQVNVVSSLNVFPPDAWFLVKYHSAKIFGPTLNYIRQTDVDTLMIRTQSRVRVRVWVRVRVRVRVRVIHLNQTGIRHKILGGVGVRVMHSRSDASSSNPTYSILNCFFP